MSEYKKAKHRRKKFFKDNKQIPMKSEINRSKAKSNDSELSNFRVIAGKKEYLKRRNLIAFSVTCLLIAVVLIFSLLSPTGLVETSTNYITGIALRDYFPSNFEGNELYSVSRKGNHFYVLSNQTFSSYNISGKRFFEHFHGCEKPVVSLSETRALIYDQNGTSVSVFNAKKQILNLTTDFPIYAADITRNGYFAIGSKAQSYTSCVTVYNDKGEFVFEWMSPDEIVTAVALSSNGKELAVCGVKTVNGIIVSNIYIFNYDSVEPVWRQTYNDTFVYDMISESNRYFCAVSQNRCDFINWKDHTIISHQTDNSIQMIRTDGNKTVVCEPHSADTYQNKFTVYNRKNEILFQYDFSGYVDDFALKNNALYILSGNTVYHINNVGETVNTAECSFGSNKIVPFSREKIVIVSDNTLNQIHFK